MRWLTTLFNFGRGNRWMFGKRNHRGMMWLSLLGIGLGGAWAYGMARDRRNGMQAVVQPLQRQWKNLMPNQ